MTYTRVVSLEGDDKVSTGWQHGHISSRRIGQRQCVGTIDVLSISLVKNVEVVTVKMYRVVLREY